MIRLLTFGAALLLAPAPRAQESASTLERLHALEAQLVELQKADPKPAMTKADVELLATAQVYVTGPPGYPEMALLATTLRTLRSLPPKEIATVVEFAAQPDRSVAAWPCVFFLVDAGHIPAAAKVIVAQAQARPREQRTYGVWKWWEHFFGLRRQYSALMRNLSLAFLDAFAAGSAEQRETIADIFGKPTMTDADIPAMRQQSLDGAKRMHAARQQDPLWPSTLWVEDGYGKVFDRRQRRHSRCGKPRPPADRASTHDSKATQSSSAATRAARMGPLR